LLCGLLDLNVWLYLRINVKQVLQTHQYILSVMLRATSTAATSHHLICRARSLRTSHGWSWASWHNRRCTYRRTSHRRLTSWRSHVRTESSWDIWRGHTLRGTKRWSNQRSGALIHGRCLLSRRRHLIHWCWCIYRCHRRWPHIHSC
jgi:hypothetical protein